MLRPIGHEPGSPSEREWHAALGNAFVAIGNKTYVIADAVTHAPITPFAPLQGRVGIGADIAREFPGMRALPVEDVAPDVRHGRIAYHDNAATHYAMCATWGAKASRPEWSVERDLADAERHAGIAAAIRLEFSELRVNAFAAV